MLLVKNPQFLYTHESLILAKFHNDWVKIVDFLLIAYFWASVIFITQSLCIRYKISIYSESQHQYRQNTNQIHDNSNVIHARLLDLLSPSQHIHPGIPYDFYTGYILMVAKNVDTNDNTENTDSYYSTGSRSHVPPTTYLYGRLPNAVITDLQRNYGTFYKVFHIK